MNKLLNLSYAQLGWSFLLIWLSYTLGMSFFVSDDFARQSVARSYSDWMAQFIPMINSISKIPGASEWNRFYYAVMWSITLVFVVIGWLMRRRMCVQGVYLKPFSDLKLCAGILFFSLCGVVLFYWPVADGRGWRDGAAVDRIFGVAHFSFCVFSFAAVVGVYARLIYARIRYGTITEPIYQGE